MAVRLCLQNDFCEEFDAVAAADAGKPVMLTGKLPCVAFQMLHVHVSHLSDRVNSPAV